MSLSRSRNCQLACINWLNQLWIPGRQSFFSIMLTTDCLQVVVAVVPSRWRYSWPRRGSCWFWCASRSRLHGHRYRQPAAGSDTCLSSGRVWCRTSPADKRCTPVQQWCKLSETESCKVFTCTKSFQRLSHARCTPVRQNFRLAHAIYTDVQQAYRLSHTRCTPVQQAFRLSHVRYTHVQRGAFGLNYVRYTHVQPALRLSHVRYTNVQRAFRLSHVRYTHIQPAFRLSHVRCTHVQQAFRLSHFRYTHVRPAFRLIHARCTPVQQCNKLSEMESCSRCTPVQQAFRDWVTLDVHQYNSVATCQRLNPARCTPTQKCNKPSETMPGLMYRCATVEQALKDQVMRNVHLERYLYIRATSFEILSDTSLNLFPYRSFTCDYFENLHIHLFQRWLLWAYFTFICRRWLLWTRSHAHISTKSLIVNNFTCSYFNDDTLWT